jgi:hypothetical protein
MMPRVLACISPPVAPLTAPLDAALRPLVVLHLNGLEQRRL